MSERICFLCRNTGVVSWLLAAPAGSAVCPCPHGDQYRGEKNEN